MTYATPEFRIALGCVVLLVLVALEIRHHQLKRKIQQETNRRLGEALNNQGN